MWCFAIAYIKMWFLKQRLNACDLCERKLIVRVGFCCFDLYHSFTVVGECTVVGEWSRKSVVN